MQKELFAWHLIFPTVFHPSCVNCIWVVKEEPTSCGFDRYVADDRFPNWHIRAIRWSDGVPACNPTLCLLMANERHINGSQLLKFTRGYEYED
jgi:hypothetical protein